MLKKACVAAALVFAHLYADEDPAFDLAQVQIEQAPVGIDFSAELRRISMTLGGIIVLGALTLLTLRRFTNRRHMRFNNTSRIQVLEQRALSQKSAAYLLKVAGKEIFCIESAHGVTAIPLDTKEASRDFHALLDERSHS